ncbi:MAG: arginine--tRNA ligase [Deltaproteobacteria bacterium]|nr:arginine--tRNA ligase [Deltaproteobacteria bacterium]
MNIRLDELIKRAVKRAGDQKLIKDIPVKVELSVPKERSHGHFSTNLAMSLASAQKMAPRKLAQIIIDHLVDEEGILDRTEIAGPGFINFFVRPEYWRACLLEIGRQGKDYGRSEIGLGKTALVEFVSANPTGPLHVGHGRGAAVGDSLARILRKAGYQVTTEYYTNDAGNQIATLGRSVFLRYLNIVGQDVDFPENCYQGDYVTEIAKDMLDTFGGDFADESPDQPPDSFATIAAKVILEGIRDDLARFGVAFDRWFSEKSLYDQGAVDILIQDFKEKGLVYQSEEAWWFKSSQFGDEKDRVVVRANGVTTYLASDLAYHKDKFERNFDLVVDIWGADHHGYVDRMKAAVAALGYQPDRLKIILIYLVNLLRDGKQVSMSTRSGEFVTLKEVVDEVGKDAARFIFLSRRSDAPLDFDLEVAKKESSENQVYYVKYVHARIVSVFNLAAEREITVPKPEEADLLQLTLPEETDIIRHLSLYPECLEAAAINMEPHRIVFYLTELASIFHHYYKHHRFIDDGNPGLTGARLVLAGAVKLVVKEGLDLLGVEAPDKM